MCGKQRIEVHDFCLMSAVDKLAPGFLTPEARKYMHKALRNPDIKEFKKDVVAALR